MVTSTLYKAKKDSKSLKATVPKEVVAALKLSAGNELDWNVLEPNLVRVSKVGVK